MSQSSVYFRCSNRLADLFYRENIQIKVKLPDILPTHGLNDSVTVRIDREIWDFLEEKEKQYARTHVHHALSIMTSWLCSSLVRKNVYRYTRKCYITKVRCADFTNRNSTEIKPWLDTILGSTRVRLSHAGKNFFKNLGSGVAVKGLVSQFPNHA